MNTTINEAIEKAIMFFDEQFDLPFYGAAITKKKLTDITTLAAAEEREACVRIVERNCTECDTCRVKPGSPILCQGCLNNRDSITAAIRARGQGNEVVSTGYMQTSL